MNAAPQLALGLDSGATFSPCRRYRYHLWRTWGSPEHRCVFVGLNPSTADETTDDPTIRRCIGFAKRWGFGAYDMLNLFAWRSTQPMGLYDTIDPIGPDNDATFARVFDGAHRIVWAWGAHNVRVGRLIRERTTASGWFAIPRRCEVGVLGRSQNGSPRHPLYLPADTRFEATP